MESKTELLTTQSELTMDVEKMKQNKDLSSELLKVKHMVNTPFTIVTAEDMGSFVAMGNARLTEYMSMEECQSMVIEKDWQLIMGMAGRIATMTFNDLKNLNNE